MQYVFYIWRSHMVSLQVLLLVSRQLYIQLDFLICPKPWSKLILFTRRQKDSFRIIFCFLMPQSLNKGAKRVNKNRCGEPTWYGSVCEGERNFVFTDSAKCSYTTWIFHAQFSHESVDTVVSAAQLRMWEDQNSIPILTLPTYYLFYTLWGINNETCNLCEPWTGRCLFNLGSTAQYQRYIRWSKNATLNQNTRRETESETQNN